jgi:hypothetical protein
MRIPSKSGYTFFICNRRQARISFWRRKQFISQLGGNILCFQAAGTSDASHEMEEAVIAEH